MKKSLLLFGILGVLVLIACSNIKADEKTKNAEKVITENKVSALKPAKELSESFKKYWYAGNAEITSYQLEQARYGEIREGKAVLIYVTEDFLSKEQVKADYQNSENIPVLKLNATKKFNTGIYPYSIMQSTFYPVADNQHAIKISSSMQEWCGHVYAQLNNRKKFDIMSHSYFEGEADQNFALDKEILENELWAKIRIDPNNLPQGDLKIIPSFEYSRLKHKEIKAYSAEATLQKDATSNIYTISYPELNRSISITFNSSFPYEIEGWTEIFKSGFGTNAKELITKATKLKSIKSAYWGKNSNKDEVLRQELGL
ncbi:septum formation inhibitor Maf [Aquimarina sp. BL5]|uniref:septum formation inhibitor Maf n=1 Tax=Aquimarina sp. BL5 TaxID=1714860 RepID=UPI000E47AC76|nr:septum formation inhibitor Maf [Aquimarina sp. BL5]AXT49295.1 septum formation inhibitor Maf [Aquimarina sp. BL5]RKN04042.1 septum formation inhibitor Maf [Aquimarina sp. BL5]